MSLVYGDQFLLLANIVLRSKIRNNYYEVKSWSQQNIVFFQDISQNWNNPKLIFCNTEDVNLLLPILQFFQNKFVLLTHNSDTNLTEEFKNIYEHPMLFHWFSQNAIVNHPKITYLPIGKANPVWQHGNQEFFDFVKNLQIPKSFHFYANFLVETNPTKRQDCLTHIQKLGIQNSPRMHPTQYFQYLSASIFSICPEGNGIDTHRFWESIYFKTIPIVLRSQFTEKLAKEYPCCLVNSWENFVHEIPTNYNLEFTPSILEKIQFPYFKNLILLKIQELDSNELEKQDKCQ